MNKFETKAHQDRELAKSLLECLHRQLILLDKKNRRTEATCRAFLAH